MHFVYFSHSLVSCWNHGNAHFQRGIMRALMSQGHTVTSWEPVDSWSRRCLILEQGDTAEQVFQSTYPELLTKFYDGVADLEQIVSGAEVVIVHEWTDPEVVKAVGELRRRNNFVLLFHDTHHRALSDPESLRHFVLSDYDGVLAFGSVLADIYRRWGWGDRAYVWHEAADTTLFKPPSEPVSRAGAVWVGNWGDGEREAEIRDFLLRPAQAADIKLDIYGVRYPTNALAMVADYGAFYHGWLANAAVPDVFATHTMTVHVPRCYYARKLPGIPTIRMFEALASGIPLISAPWNDIESLFRPGCDYLTAASSEEMRRQMLRLQNEDGLAESLRSHGRERVVAQHSCNVRVGELLSIVDRIAGRRAEASR